MTARKLTKLLWQATTDKDTELLYKVCQELTDRKLWFSGRAWIENPPTGKEVKICAEKPGICQECMEFFNPGTEVMWRTKASYCMTCWHDEVKANAASI